MAYLKFFFSFTPLDNGSCSDFFNYVDIYLFEDLFSGLCPWIIRSSIRKLAFNRIKLSNGDFSYCGIIQLFQPVSTTRLSSDYPELHFTPIMTSYRDALIQWCSHGDTVTFAPHPRVPRDYSDSWTDYPMQADTLQDNGPYDEPDIGDPLINSLLRDIQRCNTVIHDLCKYKNNLYK